MILLNKLQKICCSDGVLYRNAVRFSRGGWVAMKHPSLILRQLITCWSVVAKFSADFFEVRKAFDTVWIDGLFYRLFSELGIRGRMWLAIRDLYTNVKAQVFYEGSLSRKINLSQGTEKGRILPHLCTKCMLMDYYMGYLIIAVISLLIDYAFLLPNLQMTSLYSHCTLLFSKRLLICPTVMVSNGGMISITLKVASLRLVRLSHSILSP